MAKKAAIFKISVSLFVVSLNPGVSIRVTLLPSSVNLSATWASVVHGSKSIPTRKFERLARLINWRHSSELLIITTKHLVLTEVFPLPVAPMTLWQWSEKVSTGEWALRYARDHDGWERS